MYTVCVHVFLKIGTSLSKPRHTSRNLWNIISANIQQAENKVNLTQKYTESETPRVSSAQLEIRTSRYALHKNCDDCDDDA